MNDTILNELKVKLSDFIYSENGDTALDVLGDFIVKSILLRSKNRSIYFDEENIFLIYGHNNPQVFLERIYFDGTDLCIEVKENNHKNNVEKVLFKFMDKTNIIAVCLKLLNKEIYINQNYYLAKKNVFDAKIGAGNALNKFVVALENFLIVKFNLNKKHTFVFNEDNRPKICIDWQEYKWITIETIKRNRFGVELVDTEGVSRLLPSLDYELLTEIYCTFKVNTF